MNEIGRGLIHLRRNRAARLRSHDWIGKVAERGKVEPTIHFAYVLGLGVESPGSHPRGNGRRINGRFQGNPEVFVTEAPNRVTFPEPQIKFHAPFFPWPQFFQSRDIPAGPDGPLLLTRKRSAKQIHRAKINHLAGKLGLEHEFPKRHRGAVFKPNGISNVRPGIHRNRIRGAVREDCQRKERGGKLGGELHFFEREIVVRHPRADRGADGLCLAGTPGKFPGNFQLPFFAGRKVSQKPHLRPVLFGFRNRRHQRKAGGQIGHHPDLTDSDIAVVFVFEPIFDRIRSNRPFRPFNMEG